MKRNKCKKETTSRKNTLFENSKLQFRKSQKLSISLFATINHKKNKFKFETISNSTIFDWKNICRDVIMEYFLSNQIKIGGVGKIYEIMSACL